MIGSTITAVILAGGRGTRMGGVEKGLLDWHGRPLIAHLIEALAPQVDHILINANRSLQRYASFGLPIICDHVDFAGLGPLAGLHSALSHSPTQLTVCVPCDMPSLPADLVHRLIKASETRPDRPPLAYALSSGRAYPTLSLLHHSYRDALAASLRQGHCAAQRWLDEHGATQADTGVTPLANFNTPDALNAQGISRD
ncbi:MAG: molybdenum cofactor guanylyltransferase [Halothiobacillaceae bacterium]|nr:molybdenum cofactor guanylyltransferase [Halothiobacillaceae bacterium]